MKIVLLILISLLLILTGCKTLLEQYDGFAECLTEKGVKMYGTEWCSHCQNQKNLFGSSFQHVDYIDCDKNADACDEAGIKGYPTWIIDGNLNPGTKSLETLSELSGCQLN